MRCPHGMQTPRAKRKTDDVGQAFLPVHCSLRLFAKDRQECLSYRSRADWAGISMPQHRALPGIPFACEGAYNSGQESTYGSAGRSRSTHFIGSAGRSGVGALQLDASTSAPAKVTCLPPSPPGIAIFHPRFEPLPAFPPRHVPSLSAHPRVCTRLRPLRWRSAFVRRSVAREMTCAMDR
jgi:hypothetical protein